MKKIFLLFFLFACFKKMELKEKGKRYKTGSKGGTILMTAAAEGNLNLVKYYLDTCDINAQTPQGWTALMNASKGGHRLITQLLVQEGAIVDKVNIVGMTAFMIACQENKGNTANALLERGANINKANIDGWTALMSAAIKDQKNMVAFLLKKGADKTLINNDEQTAYDLASSPEVKQLLSKQEQSNSESEIKEEEEVASKEGIKRKKDKKTNKFRTKFFEGE